jgi:DNA-directed RNA polymerase subunit RPC12/RpoP/chromosome segregation ATPase
MSQAENQKQAMYAQLNSIESDISLVSAAVNGARNNIAHVEGSVVSLPSRLGKVRERGYAAMGHMEKDTDLLSKKWTEMSPSVKQAFATSIEPLATQADGLRAEARGLQTQIDSGNIPYSQSLANRLSAASSSLRERIATEEDKVNAPLCELTSSINSLDQDLKVAEQTIEFFSQANFPLKPEESPVLAVEGKILKGDKNKGTLYFTNQRFVFEARKEVVLEKKFFVATKKKIERVVQINQPIGALQEISKGRVGLIAWTGIYVRFKPDSREEDAQFDVEGWEADLIGRFFDYIIDGDADKDIAVLRGTAGTTAAAPLVQVVYCSRCFAPYTREIFKGQKTVQCEYCGTQIIVQ